MGNFKVGYHDGVDGNKAVASPRTFQGLRSFLIENGVNFILFILS